MNSPLKFQKTWSLKRLIAPIKTNKLVFICVVIFLIIIFLVFLGWMFGIRINLTASAPIGFWKIKKGFKKGEFVLICLPKSHIQSYEKFLNKGQCENGYAPLLKKIMGERGDQIAIENHTVWINEKMVTMNQQLKDKKQCSRINLNLRYSLDKEEYFVLNTAHPCSLDSRHFGKVQRRHILSGIKPILIFN